MKRNIDLIDALGSFRELLKSMRMKGVFFLLILLTSCKDEDKVNPNSFLKYEDTTYPLENGWIKNIENINGGIDHTIISLYSSGVSWDNSLEKFKGKGHSIFISFRRSDKELIKGTYNYQASTIGPYSLTISTASFSIDWNWENNTGLYGYFREGSVVDVAEEDGYYSLTFTLKPTLTLGNITSDSPVTGVFKGRLTKLD